MNPAPELTPQPDHQRRNLRQSVVLLVGIGSILVLATALVWGAFGALLTAAVLAGVFVLAPRVPPHAVMRLYRATRVPQDDGQLASLVDVLASRAGLKNRPALSVNISRSLS